METQTRGNPRENSSGKCRGMTRVSKTKEYWMHLCPLAVWPGDSPAKGWEHRSSQFKLHRLTESLEFSVSPPVDSLSTRPFGSGAMCSVLRGMLFLKAKGWKTLSRKGCQADYFCNHGVKDRIWNL